MDSIGVSGTLDTGSIPVEATYILRVFFAYVLKSVGHEYYYKGHCHDLEKRLQEHNSGMTFSIRPYLPFKIVYFESFETEIKAIKREKFLRLQRVEDI